MILDSPADSSLFHMALWWKKLYGCCLTFSPPITGTPVHLVHHQFPVDWADDLMDILQTYPCNSHGRRIWKLAQAFKYIQMYRIHKWFYFIALVLLHWNKCNWATFFGKYSFLWGVPLPLMGYPLKVLWPGPATNLLFLQIYLKYFIIEQTYNKKLF
jgi:hypothetical protein